MINMKKLYDAPQVEIEVLMVRTDVLTLSNEPTTRTGNENYGNEYDDDDATTTTLLESGW